jgi:predicted O-methyltransferase YrrM
MLRVAAPRRVVEIGTASGGSLFLLARVAAPDAVLVSVDLPDAPDLPGYASWREALYRSFAAPGQTIHLVRGDSHQEATRDRVRERIGGDGADVVFIDGDHRYAGVARDCELYAPLARPGGIVAFHDIVPDHRTRYGIDTVNDSGDVHRFWGEYKTRGTATEIVEDPGQNGFGIGVVVAGAAS